MGMTFGSPKPSDFVGLFRPLPIVQRGCGAASARVFRRQVQLLVVSACPCDAVSQPLTALLTACIVSSTGYPPVDMGMWCNLGAHGSCQGLQCWFESSRLISDSGDVVQRQHSVNRRQVQLLTISALLLQRHLGQQIKVLKLLTWFSGLSYSMKTRAYLVGMGCSGTEPRETSDLEITRFNSWSSHIAQWGRGVASAQIFRHQVQLLIASALRHTRRRTASTSSIDSEQPLLL